MGKSREDERSSVKVDSQETEKVTWGIVIKEGSGYGQKWREALSKQGFRIKRTIHWSIYQYRVLE